MREKLRNFFSEPKGKSVLNLKSLKRSQFDEVLKKFKNESNLLLEDGKNDLP